MSTENHKEFIIREFMYFSIQAGFATRNKEFPVYNRDFDDFTAKKKLKNDVEEYLLNCYKKYSESIISEEKHKKKICSLSNKITRNHGAILNNKEFRFGVSQKIINLFLKYLWSVDLIKEPCHCPFDNIVKLEIQKYSKNKCLSDWTKMTTMNEYDEYVSAARVAALKEGSSIARWELNNWKRR